MGDIKEIMRQFRHTDKRGLVRCEECGEQLSYEYNSIVWRCIDKHLCPSCAGKAAAQRVLRKYRRRVRAALAEATSAPPPDTGRDTVTPRDTGGGDG